MRPTLTFGAGLVGKIRPRRVMRLVNKGAPPKGGQYLVCSGAVRGLCAHKTHHSYTQIEDIVLRGIAELDFSRIAAGGNADDEIRACRDTITTLNEHIKNATRKRRNLLEAFADAPDHDTRSLIEKFAADIEVARADLRKEQRILKELENGVHDLAKHASEIERLRSILVNAPDDERYRIRAACNQELKEVLRKITFHADRSWTVQLQKSLKHYSVIAGRFVALEENQLFAALAALDDPEPDMALIGKPD